MSYLLRVLTIAVAGMTANMLPTRRVLCRRYSGTYTDTYCNVRHTTNRSENIPSYATPFKNLDWTTYPPSTLFSILYDALGVPEDSRVCVESERGTVYKFAADYDLSQQIMVLYASCRELRKSYPSAETEPKEFFTLVYTIFEAWFFAPKDEEVLSALVTLIEGMTYRVGSAFVKKFVDAKAAVCFHHDNDLCCFSLSCI